QLFVLRLVRVMPQPGRDEHEVVVHFIPQVGQLPGGGGRPLCFLFGGTMLRKQAVCHQRASATQRPEQPNTSAALPSREPNPGSTRGGATPTARQPAEAAVYLSTQRPAGPNAGKSGPHAKHGLHATIAVMPRTSRTEGMPAHTPLP